MPRVPGVAAADSETQAMKQFLKDLRPVIILVICCAVFTAVLFLGRYAGILFMERDAVKAGKAEYLTTESGEEIWRWKP
jgi:hypothetical protein